MFQATQANLQRLGINRTGESIGDFALKGFDFYTERYWIWIGIAYLWAMFIVCTFLSAAALRYIGSVKKQATVQDETAVGKAREEALQRKLQMQKTQGDVESRGQDFSITKGLSVEPITLVFQNLR